jgi:hypothetical protein
MATFASTGFAAAPLRGGYRRADVELHRVDLAVPSYEGRVFLNRPDADRDTPLDTGHGYLGSFFVFGKGECWGDDEDHCAEPTARPFDHRRPPNRYAKIRVRIRDGVLQQLAAGADGDLTLHVVPVVAGDETPPGDVLRFDRLSIVTYD